MPGISQPVGERSWAAPDPSEGSASGVSGDLAREWARILVILKSEVGEVQFNSWLRPLRVIGLNDGEASLAVPTRFIRDWITTHYLDRIQMLWAAENPTVSAIDLVIIPGLDASTVLPVAGSTETGPVRLSPEHRPAAPATGGEPVDLGMDSNSGTLDPRLTFEHFVVGKPNEFAHAAARRVAELKRFRSTRSSSMAGSGLARRT